MYLTLPCAVFLITEIKPRSHLPECLTQTLSQSLEKNCKGRGMSRDTETAPQANTDIL